jgi:hypothetical protein
VIGVTAVTREMGHRLQNGAGLALRPPFWYRALTINLLPLRLREEFQFSFEEREQRSASRALRWIRRVHLKLPAAMRFVGPYNEAMSRLKGNRPGIATYLANRLWIGQAELFGNRPMRDSVPAPASRQNFTEL